VETRLNVSVIEDWRQVCALSSEWNDLLAQSRGDALFLTWEWIAAWARVKREKVSPAVICVRSDSGELVGLAPFYRATLRLGSTLTYRTLRIMADYATGAEYPDWIVRTDVEEVASQAIVDALVARQRDWDCLWMPNVASWTGAVDRVLRACQAGGLLWRTRPCDFAAVTLPDTMDAYVRALSANKRQQMKAERKRFGARPDVVVQRCERSAELPQFLEALLELHHKRWKMQGEEGSFRRKPELADFYQQFVPVALAKGWLWLFALRDCGKYKAVQLGYVYNHVFHQLQEGFDPEYEPGAGNLLRAHVIEACIGAGIQTVDFLGGATEHKRRWLAETRTGCDIFVGKRALKNHPLFAFGVWPTGRYLRPSGL
jgi:CelD/BcsL family acetyltransferase involved in cellulose biosynthesis